MSSANQTMIGEEDEDPLLSLSGIDEIPTLDSSKLREGGVDSTSAGKQQDIYEESFKELLKDFCHNYQIPFLENNIPKSCRQAAKIYYRLVEAPTAGETIPERYQRVVDHLKSIPQEEIDDQFNPFKMREKWMKFFRTGFQRVLVDTDRALKNDLSDSLKVFIND